MSTAAGTSSTGLVGREAVVTVCTDAVDRARQGSGGLLLVSGEAGIGKTAVLQAVAQAAADRGCTVAWAACPEDDAVPSFWPLQRVLSDIGAEPTTSAAAELAAGDRDGADVHRVVLFDRVACALRQAASSRPLVLVLDDLHWSDPSSLRLLAFLVKQIRTARILVLGSYRDTDVGPASPLLELLAEPGTSGATLTLTGLGTDDVETLVARLGGERNSAAAGRIRSHTGGNPFFVLHVAGLLGAEGRLTGSGSALPLPVGVRAVLERRLARLSQPCAELLGIAAIIGSRIDLGLLAEVSGQDRSTVADLLARSAAAKLTQAAEDGNAHEFAHALVRATVTAQLPAARAAELHGRVADVLLRRHGDDEVRLAEIAHHELNAPGDRPATRGVDAAERAGRHALTARAFEQAAGHFQRAIAACPAPERVARLQLRLGDAHLRAGDWGAAGDAFSAAAELARELPDPELFARAALGIGADPGGFEVRLGDHRQVAMLEEALVLLGSASPALRSRLLARRSVAATNIAPTADRAAWSDEAVALARAAGDGRTLAYALSAWCDVRSGPSFAGQRLAAAAEMATTAAAASDREAALMALRFRIVALLEVGDPRVHEEIERFATVADALGQPLYRWYVPLFRGMQALLRGDLDEADRLCALAAELGAEAGSANAEMLSATQSAGIAFERGRFVELAHLFESSLRERPELREMPIATAMAPLIDVALGREDQARGKLHALAAERFAHVPVDSEWLSTLSGISMAVLRLEEPVSAAALYDVLLPSAGCMIVDGIAATCLDPVDFLLGRFALILDRPDQAVAHLRAAAAQSRRLGARLLEAHAHSALGAALAGSDPVLGAELRRSARAVLDAAGAAPFFVVETDAGGRPTGGGAGDAELRTGVFRRDGATWTLTFDGRTVLLPDAKGLHDLRHLLARPATPVPASALQHAGDPARPSPSRGIDVLDDRARAEYRRRLEELDADIADAEAMGDGAAAARARDERSFLISELSAAVGLGGRSRRLGDDADRSRKAVTMRVRNAVARIGREHPALARHLDLAVRTGAVCSYDPEHPVEWSV